MGGLQPIALFCIVWLGMCDHVKEWGGRPEVAERISRLVLTGSAGLGRLRRRRPMEGCEVGGKWRWLTTGMLRVAETDGAVKPNGGL